MRLALLIWGLLCTGVVVAEEFFATVGGEVITRAVYEAHVDSGLRQKFYHGKIPAAQLLEFREEMAQELIDRVLLVREARRRGFKPQAGHVEAVVEQMQQRYRHDPAWQQAGTAMLAQLRDGAERRDLIAQLRAAVRLAAEPASSGAPDEASVRAYYHDHADKFTTPERLHLSMMMLAVAAWAPSATWQAAEQEALRLVQRLQSGKAAFAELARLHSSDASAAQGGDMGYVHAGMLAAEAQAHVQGLAVGEIAAPLRLLQGIAIFRLEGRQAAQLNGFEQVRERASGLLQRQRQQQAWVALIEGLRQRTAVQRHEMAMGSDG